MTYIVIPKSQSAHCCFEATVVDTNAPKVFNGVPYIDDGVPQYEAVCECFDIADAQRIANALNAEEESAT